MDDQNKTRDEGQGQNYEKKKFKINRRKFLIGTGIIGVAASTMGYSLCIKKSGVSNPAGSYNDADFIFIGSGHNSLSCAMLLARAGYKVLILEGASQIGGAAKTQEITLPGFKHDLYSANIGLFLGSPTFREFKDDLFEQGFKPVVSDFPMSSVFPDNTAMAVYRDANKTYNSLKQYSQQDADTWVELFAYFNKCAPHFLPLLQRPMPSFAAFRQAWSLVRKLGVKGASELAQLLLKSPRQYCAYWFEHPKSQALFIPWAMHLDFGPDVSGGATFPFIETPIYQTFGMPLSEGGVSNMINSMAGVIKKKGGIIQSGRKVEKILVKNGQAIGVLTSDGQKIYTRKSVIANVTPHQLINNLISDRELPADYVRKSKKFRFGPGTMMVHLALNGPVEWAAGSEYGKFNYVHIGPYVEDLAKTYADAINGILPASPMLIVGQLSVTDPARTPKGKHLLWIQVRVLPPTPRADAVSGNDAITPGPWPRIKQRYADRVINKLEQYAPGVTDKILKRIVLSPADLENDNPNLVGGDSLAGSHHLDQFYMFRPIPGWARYETPIKGLYMIGASTWPGAGLHATSGYLLAKDLLALY